MLTVQQITDEYLKYRDYYCDNTERVFNSNGQTQKYHYLVNSDWRLIAISKHKISCKSMEIMDKHYRPTLSVVETVGSIINWKDQNISVVRAECWKLKLNNNKTLWEENLKFYSTDELYELMLANQKVACLDALHDKIEYSRARTIKSFLAQDFIYHSKYIEAKEILEKNIEEDTLWEFPFTTSYAKLKNISLQESAKLIKLQYEFQAYEFAESENLRLKYKKLIIEETDIKNLKTHVTSAIIEHDGYSFL